MLVKYTNIMLKDKEYYVKKSNVVLKVSKTEEFIITSWKHNCNNHFTNERKFALENSSKLIDTLKPVCSDEQLKDIYIFLSDNKEGEQLTLF